MINIKALSDAELTELLHDRVARERDCSADVVEALAEFDRRRLQEKTRYPTLFAYCTKVLRYSEDAACFRINVARKSGQFPAILALLASGELSLSTINRLAPHLKKAEDEKLLFKAVGLSTRAVETMVAHLSPRSEPREVIRQLGPRPPLPTARS